jgi:enamine deaminase RidA (YjgF/YER057c/UK114 family)
MSVRSAHRGAATTVLYDVDSAHAVRWASSETERDPRPTRQHPTAPLASRTEGALMTTVKRWNVADVAPPAGRYSLITKCSRDCDLVLVSGQFGVDAHGTIAGQDTRAQARQLFANLAAVLGSLGSKPSDLLYINSYLSRDACVADYLDERTAIFQDWFDDEASYPGSTLLVVHALVSSAYLVEVDAMVAVPRQ